MKWILTLVSNQGQNLLTFGQGDDNKENNDQTKSQRVRMIFEFLLEIKMKTSRYVYFIIEKMQLCPAQSISDFRSQKCF